MKVSLFEFEGTAEELDSSVAVAELLHHGRSAPGGAAAMSAVPGHVVGAEDAAATETERETNEGPAKPDVLPGVAEEGQETVRRLLDRNPAGDLFVDFLKETTAWPNVRAHGIKRKGARTGESLDYNRYLRLRKQGSAFGGFAYVYAVDGTCNLRLHYDTDAELAELAPAAWPVLTGHREYRVSIQITDEQSLRQAIDLARLAYEAT